ncbi:CRISPR-associated endoribonuclease Cas6 [uncultured Clostridium sp.]|uniref:CRISPR-associated endoribonuclease Cas6 n=1 Tax=uncultured Clostridium sp. TaxID=59620 RepID=UPI0025CC3D9D|nr:CRISPR-associated endoribonuclease Cas6 [uncultured Clostridium sp.]
MNVIEIKLQIYLLKDIPQNKIQSKITSLIDGALAKENNLLMLHNSNQYKNYCFNQPYPIEKDKLYKEGNIYTLTLRTIDKSLATFFNNKLVNEYNSELKALKADIKVIPKKQIQKIYSLTPIILKTDSGYWKGVLSIDEFERRLKENLIKKYKFITNEKIEAAFDLYTDIEFKNKKPIATEYKGIKLLGDKINLEVADNPIAQELAYLSLGVGICEMNARGFGFLNYQWI